MGQEISQTAFSDRDLAEFKSRLREETKILYEWFKNDAFERTNGMCGAEVEAWLTNQDFLPNPNNGEFLDQLKDPMVVSELSKFNFELNTTPQPTSGKSLKALESDLIKTWQNCTKTAAKLDSNILTIGILPTIRDYMLTLEYMSSMKRYIALNEQCLRLRKGRPFKINITGKDSIELQREDLMMEAAATSLQIHLQVNSENAKRYFNASQILSAPMVALSANSPYLFGKDLWDETRIPTFEQAVNIASFRDRHGETIRRVTFGSGYVRESIFEKFLENLDGYPILLPLVTDDDPSWLNHLRLQNGTIWRWNRPLIGLNDKGNPHLRIEHRVAAAGPSIPDMVAHIAFYLGLVDALANMETAPETSLSFALAKDNFYKAARKGFSAEITWLDGKKYDIQSLLLEQLVPLAKDRLIKNGFDKHDVSYYMDDILHRRVIHGRNGAAWQRAFVSTHGPDFQEMTHAYYENQQTHKPVHQWKV